LRPSYKDEFGENYSKRKYIDESSGSIVEFQARGTVRTKKKAEQVLYQLAFYCRTTSKGQSTQNSSLSAG
jgi:hypothetical protein